MTDINRTETICSVCGAKIRVSTPGSLPFAEGEEDLDLRPEGTGRGLFRGWIHACPRCGNVARKLEDPAKVSEDFLRTDRYTNCDGISFQDKKAAQYYRLYLIAEHTGDLEEQLFGIRGAAWACDDSGDAENARLCRQIGVGVLDQLLREDDDAYHQMLRMDFLRRSGQLKKLQEQYAGKRFEDRNAERARRFHLDLAKAGDTGCHSMKELPPDIGPVEPEEGDATVLLNDLTVNEQEKTIVAPKGESRTFDPPKRDNRPAPEQHERREHREHWEHIAAPASSPRRSDTPDFSLKEQEEMLRGLNESPEPQPQPEKHVTKKTSGGANGKKAIIAAIIIILLLAGGFLLGKMLAGSLSDEETPVTSEENKDFTAVTADSVEILSSDWDWDSREVDDLNDRKQVYAILLVENNSDTPIFKIEFEAKDKYGDDIKDVDHPEEPLVAEGYVKAGQKGIMVADVHLDKDASQSSPHRSDYDITAAYGNEDIDEDYEVPTGKISQQIEESYDVELSNPNEDEVNRSALLVAVKVRDDRIKESDATGKLTNPIPGGTPAFMQERAFYDPGLNTDNDDLVIYVIDRDYYKDAR